MRLAFISRFLTVVLALAGAAPSSSAFAAPQDCVDSVLAPLGKVELRLRRNEIYARLGMPFKDPELKAHFAKMPWYKPSASFSFDQVPEADKACVQRIEAFEKGGPKWSIKAAYPVVDLWDGKAWRRQGEILRNLVGPDAKARQELALNPPAGAKTVRLRLSEEKDETTFVDQLSLEVDGRIIAPGSCQEGDGEFCKEDGVDHILRRGEVLELTFSLPGAWSRVMLRANGYYVPGDRVSGS